MSAIHQVLLGGGAANADAIWAAYNYRVANQTTYTFTAHGIGTAAANRYVVVLIAGGANGRTVSSVTVAGQSCTVISTLTNGVRDAAMAITASPVTSGTTADVVVTWSGGENRCHIGTYALTGIGSKTPTDTGTDTGSGNRSTSIDILAGGSAIGLMVHSAGTSGSTTWTGLNEDVDTSGDGVITFSAASLDSSTAQTGLSVSATGSSTSLLIVAAWR